MPQATLEQRLTALEETVRELQDAMDARQPAPDWLDRVIGSMKDEPAFDEVLAHGRGSSAMKFLLDTDHIPTRSARRANAMRAISAA